MKKLVVSLAVIIAILSTSPVNAGFVGWSQSDRIAITDELTILTNKLGEDLASGITFYHLDHDAPTYSCWASMRCYGAFDYANNPKFRGLIVHEIGHRFLNENGLGWSDLNYSLGYYENGKYVHVSGTNPETGRYERTDLGYIQPNQPYCQHCSYMNPGGQSYREDFADMFMAWAMGYFSNDDAGRARQNFMDSFISEWFPGGDSNDGHNTLETTITTNRPSQCCECVRERPISLCIRRQ